MLMSEKEQEILCQRPGRQAVPGYRRA